MSTVTSKIQASSQIEEEEVQACRNDVIAQLQAAHIAGWRDLVHQLKICIQMAESGSAWSRLRVLEEEGHEFEYR